MIKISNPIEKETIKVLNETNIQNQISLLFPNSVQIKYAAKENISILIVK